MDAIERVFNPINEACMFMFGFKIDFEARITSMIKDGGGAEARVKLDWQSRDNSKLEYDGLCNKHLCDS